MPSASTKRERLTQLHPSGLHFENKLELQVGQHAGSPVEPAAFGSWAWDGSIAKPISVTMSSICAFCIACVTEELVLIVVHRSAKFSTRPNHSCILYLLRCLQQNFFISGTWLIVITLGCDTCGLRFFVGFSNPAPFRDVLLLVDRHYMQPL
jgi:hypothetical protein